MKRQSDGAGGHVDSWEGLGTLWAYVKPGSGRERSGVEITYSRISYKIIVRAAPHDSKRRPAPGQRFRDGVKIMNITAVTEHDGRGMYLICFAQEEKPV